MKELIKPIPLEDDYKLSKFLDESCSDGCNKVCCETVRGGCQNDPNSSIGEDDDLLF